MVRCGCTVLQWPSFPFMRDRVGQCAGISISTYFVIKFWTIQGVSMFFWNASSVDQNVMFPQCWHMRLTNKDFSCMQSHFRYNLWDSPRGEGIVLVFFPLPFSPPSLPLGRWNVHGENASIRVAWRQICGAFSRLEVNVGGLRRLRLVVLSCISRQAARAMRHKPVLQSLLSCLCLSFHRW